SHGRHGMVLKLPLVGSENLVMMDESGVQQWALWFRDQRFRPVRTNERLEVVEATPDRNNGKFVRGRWHGASSKEMNEAALLADERDRMLTDLDFEIGLLAG